MTVILFVIPLKSGKTEAYKAFIAECVGPRRAEYKDLLLRYGCNSLQIWIHTLSGTDYAMFTHDMAENAQELLQDCNVSQ